VVVDDGSTDATSVIAKGILDPRIDTLMRLPGNQGLARGRNLVLSKANTEVISFIDADGEAHEKWVEETEFFFRTSAPRVAVMASLVRFSRNPRVVNGLGGMTAVNGLSIDHLIGLPFTQGDQVWAVPTAHASKPKLVNYAMGNGLCVRKSAWSLAGGFDETTPNYFDDVAFCLKLRRIGFETVANPRAHLLHYYGHSSESNTIMKAIVLERSRITCLIRLWPRKLAVAAVRAEWRYLKFVEFPRKLIILRCWLGTLFGLLGLIRDRRQLQSEYGPMIDFPDEFFVSLDEVLDASKRPLNSDGACSVPLVDRATDNCLGYLRINSGGWPTGINDDEAACCSEWVEVPQVCSFDVEPFQQGVKIVFEVADGGAVIYSQDSDGQLEELAKLPPHSKTSFEFRSRPHTLSRLLLATRSTCRLMLRAGENE